MPRVSHHHTPAGNPPEGADSAGSPKRLWEAVLERLQLQVPKATFDTWLAESRGQRLTAGELSVSTPTASAVEWLEGRMQGLSDTTASDITARSISVRFFVEGARANLRQQAAQERQARRPPRSRDPRKAEALRKALLWILRKQRIRGSRLAVAEAIIEHVDEQGETFISQARIAAESAWSVRTVIRQLQGLCETGFIEVTMRVRDGKRKTNIYRIAGWLRWRARRLLEQWGSVMESIQRAADASQERVRLWYDMARAKVQGAGAPRRKKRSGPA